MRSGLSEPRRGRVARFGMGFLKLLPGLIIGYAIGVCAVLLYNHIPWLQQQWVGGMSTLVGGLGLVMLASALLIASLVAIHVWQAKRKQKKLSASHHQLDLKAGKAVAGCLVSLVLAGVFLGLAWMVPVAAAVSLTLQFAVLGSAGLVLCGLLWWQGHQIGIPHYFGFAFDGSKPPLPAPAASGSQLNAEPVPDPALAAASGGVGEEVSSGVQGAASVHPS